MSAKMDCTELYLAAAYDTGLGIVGPGIVDPVVSAAFRTNNGSGDVCCLV